MDESTGSGVAGSVQWGYQYIPHSSQHLCSAIPASRQWASRFDNIRANAVANDKLDLLLKYVKRYWMDSSTFPLSTRNVYRKETQTNNNCKGWHRRISHCAMEKAPLMYCLIPILYSEAEKLPLQKQMVEDRSLQRRQQKDTRDHQRQFEDLWGQFEERHLTDIQFLRGITKICGPSGL